jgi:nitroreductase
VIAQVLDAARFAPSGHNDQSTEFVVVQDREMIHEIAALAAGYLRGLGRQFGNPVGRTIMRLLMGRRGAEYVGELAPEMEHLATLFDSGTDWILHESPVLVVFCADSAGGTFAGVSANLALQNAALAAETLGLGCFYAGFVVIASEREGRIAELLSLPKTHKIYGALAMGYPRLTFKQWPERQPARVTWVGAD